MRHGKRVNHLGRQHGHRKALLKNLSNALIKHKRINTTLAKAKALRMHLEPQITKGKNNTLHSRRVVFSYLQDKNSIQELFGEIADKIGDRPGGYLRIIKTGFRKGDAAETAMIEFVDYNPTYAASIAESVASGTKTKKKRTRRGRKKNQEATTPPPPVATADEEE